MIVFTVNIYNRHCQCLGSFNITGPMDVELHEITLHHIENAQMFAINDFVQDNDIDENEVVAVVQSVNIVNPKKTAEKYFAFHDSIV